MSTKKYRILLDSQTQTNGVMLEADYYELDAYGWIYFNRDDEVVFFGPVSRVMGVLVADDSGKFEQCLANNDVESLSNGVRYAHDRLDAIERNLYAESTDIE